MNTKKESVIIWGSGGHARVVIDILLQMGNYIIIGLLDSAPEAKGRVVDGYEVLGGEECLRGLESRGVSRAIVAIGNNAVRCRIAQQLRGAHFNLVNAIHPWTTIANHVTLGTNITIALGATVCVHTVIEDDVIINTGAIVEHENRLQKGSFVAPGAQLAGRVTLQEQAFVGIGATVIQNITVGQRSIVGAGAVVIHDIPNEVVALGVPAKVQRKRSLRDFL